MILRNGINSTLRAKGRTVLFTLLILILTLALTLGMGTWAYSSALLNQMDSAYTSVALVEYMGAEYPDPDVADSYARAAAEALDDAAITALEGVKLWERADKTLANVAGYTRMQGEIPYTDHSVLLCTSFTPLMMEGWVQYTEEELPSQYVLTDGTNWQAKMKDGQQQTDWIPYYELRDGQYIRMVSWNYEAGSSTYETTPADQLPNEYIYQQNTGWNTNYYYVKNGQRVLTIQKTRSNSSPVFTYEPDSGIINGSGQVVKSYTGICVDPLYCREYDGEFLMTLLPGQAGLEVQPKTRYVLHGYFSPSGNNHNNFVLAPFYEGCDLPPWQVVEDGQYDPIFDEYAQKYATANNYVRLEASHDVAALEVFQQNVLKLEQGRFPKGAEPGVCVVSHDIALQLDLKVGGTIDLTVLTSEAEDRFELSKESEKELEVVGITTINEEYAGCVWVSDAEGGFSAPLFGYQIGQVVLDNATARQTADAISALCAESVRVTLYDQGYSAAAQPLQTMRTTAMAVTAAAACGTVAVLLLFAFLFVGRQKETVQVLISLGTPAGKIRLWLLSGAALICGVATAIGALIGGMALESIITAAMEAAKGLYVADQRYSEAAIGFVREAVTVETMPLWPAIVSGCAVFVLALVLCLVFLKMARKQTTPKRGKQTVRVPKSGTSVRGRGAVRFALLSAKRGGWRSAVVPAAALVLSLLLGFLAAGAQGWSEQIDALYRDTKIRGQTVSTNGRQSAGLQVSTDNARKLWKSGLLEEIGVSIGWNYYFADEMPDFGIGEFAEYARQKWIGKQPRIIALNQLEAAPEFMYGQQSEITWLEGWDESFLRGEEYYSFTSAKLYFEMGKLLEAEHEPMAYPCLVSSNFMERRELQLGQTFQTTMQYEHYTWEEEQFVELYPVGVFQDAGGQGNLYVPIGFWCSESWITGPEDMLAPGDRVTMRFESAQDREKFFYRTTNFGTCVFTLKQAADLDAMRDYLQGQKFSRVGNLTSNRTTVILKDQTFVETVDGLGRYISFSQLLFPVLFAVVALLGFIVSWLMISGRRMEFAILRGLGASRVRVFFSFFLEQLLLCVVGCGLGCIALLALTGLGAAQYLAAAIFLGCYLAGCALSVMAVGRTELMQLLSERE